MPRRGLIISLSIHLPFYSWKYQSEQTITIRSQFRYVFLVEYLDKISIQISLCDGFWAAMDLPPPHPGQKIGKKKTCLNLNMKDPESMAGKITVEYTVTVKIRLLPKSTCKFLHPEFGKKNVHCI